MSVEHEIILSTSYLPPVWYIASINAGKNFYIDAHEHFVKQTIRNRCHILSPNGIQSLIIPVQHPNRFQIPVKDLKISYESQWQRNHWRSLNAAYRRSAFFEFYMDDLSMFYEKKFEFLLDFNSALLDFLLQQLRIKTEILFTNTYEPQPVNLEDLRPLCNTGDPAPNKTEIKYPQVFSYKSGFVSGLSSVDLLFNIGSKGLY